ncbi:hypothetical protein [Armatimonas sp.]|uniref:hypothetical protein n=1 Tax=Armatimonas sp. TaxID=1872638 RepID=UPI00286D3C57|nr:hypothetical protein [Armatimonas sp.]
MKSLLTHLECSKTGEHYDADVPQNLSRVGAPLLRRIDFFMNTASSSKKRFVHPPSEVRRL